MKENTNLMETGMDNSDLVYSDSKSVSGGSEKRGMVKGAVIGGAGMFALAAYGFWRFKRYMEKKIANEIRKEIKEGKLVPNEEEGDVESE